VKHCPVCRIPYKQSLKRHRYAEKDVEELNRLIKERDEIINDTQFDENCKEMQQVAKPKVTSKEEEKCNVMPQVAKSKVIPTKDEECQVS